MPTRFIRQYIDYYYNSSKPYYRYKDVGFFNPDLAFYRYPDCETEDQFDNGRKKHYSISLDEYISGVSWEDPDNYPTNKDLPSHVGCIRDEEIGIAYDQSTADEMLTWLFADRQHPEWFEKNKPAKKTFPNTPAREGGVLLI